MPGSSLSVKGRYGRLLWGSRPVTEFEQWTAKSDGPQRLLVDVQRHQPDPVFWSYHEQAAEAELELGQHIVFTGRVELVGVDPLQFVLHEDGE